MEDDDFDDTESTLTNKKRPKKRSIAHKLATNVNNNKTRQSSTDHHSEHDDFANDGYDLKLGKQKFENDDATNWQNGTRKTDSFRNSLVKTSSRSSLSIKDPDLESNLYRNSSGRNIKGQKNFTNHNSSLLVENGFDSEIKSFRKNSVVKNNNLNRTLDKSSLENLNRSFEKEINGYHHESKFTKTSPTMTPRNLNNSKDLYSKSTTDITKQMNPLRKNSSQIDFNDNYIPQSTRGRSNLLSPDYTLSSERLPPKEFHRSIPNITKSENFSTRLSLHEKDVFNTRNDSFNFHDDGASKMSLASSVLAIVPTERIRNRSYLVGSTNTGLLGSEELMRYFPNKRIRVHISTWNVCEMKSTPDNVDNLLLPKISEVLFDMYVIGTQETAFDRQEWCIKLQETLGPHFVLYSNASHGTLNLVVFIRRDLIWFLSAPEESTVTTRMGPSSIKTKGAVGIAFILFGSPMVFINSHFKAHEGKFEDRVEDYRKIASNLNFPKTVTQKFVKGSSSSIEQFDVTSLFDHVFWMGDLNSRMEIEREKIGGAMTSGEIGLDQIERLLEVDELKRLMNEQLAFKDFSEGRIKFLPTYKFDVGTDNYDTSNKNRKPSYTDRILYRCKKKSTISCLHYDSVASFLQSDHKPVFGVYEAELRPGLDDIMLSGGQFNRDIWIEGTKRRAAQQLVKQRSADKSSVCVLM